ELISHLISAVFAEAQERLVAVKPQSAQDVRLQKRALIDFSKGVAEEEAAIKTFLYEHMYRHERVIRVMGEAEQILFNLFSRYQKSSRDLPAEWLVGAEADDEADRARRIGNFIAGMTDRFAMTEHQRLFDSTPDLR